MVPKLLISEEENAAAFMLTPAMGLLGVRDVSFWWRAGGTPAVFLQDGTVLGDVLLPDWADGSPERFVLARGL